MEHQTPWYGDRVALRVTLREIQPEIWRRIIVPTQITLDVLDQVLQISFGWTNSHLHDFRVGDVRLGMAGTDDEMFVVDEAAAPLGAVIRKGSVLTYQYDFGDSWEHDLLVEDLVSDPENLSIVCTDGRRACPPEDCGGPGGYEHLLEVLEDPSDEEYADMKAWVPRKFDPEKLDLAAVNRKLAPISRALAAAEKRRRSGALRAMRRAQRR